METLFGAEWSHAVRRLATDTQAHHEPIASRTADIGTCTLSHGVAVLTRAQGPPTPVSLLSKVGRKCSEAA
jgi:hypothetical protein